MLGRLWAALGRLLRRTKPSQPLGIIAAPAAVLGGLTGLLGMLPAIVGAGVVGYVAFNVGEKWGERQGFKTGYAQHRAEVAAATQATNARIAELEADLEATRLAREDNRERMATSAIVGVPNVPKCVYSECALPAASIAALNAIDDETSAKNETYGPLIVRDTP